MNQLSLFPDFGKSTLPPDFHATHCCTEQGFCRYYRPQQIPGEDQNAGICQNPAILQSTDLDFQKDKNGIAFYEKVQTRTGKIRKQKVMSDDRPDWIPNLKRCPGQALIPWGKGGRCRHDGP
jgi:ferredoxin